MPHTSKVSLLALTTLSTATFGQMTILSTTRSVQAYQEWLFDNRVQTFSSPDAGTWSATATVPHSQAFQSSTIFDAGFDMHSHIRTDGGGAGHQASARSDLIMTFDVAAPMRWDLNFAYQGAQGPSDTIQFTRVDIPENLLASVHWYDWYPEPVVLSGFLDPGRYQMYVTSGQTNQGVPTTHDITFNVSVPAPATWCPLLATPLACRRRKR